MSKPSFLGVVNAVDRVCFGLAVGAATGALAGAALFVWELMRQEVGYGGWIEFEPLVDVAGVAYGGAAHGMIVGGFVGFVIGSWRAVRGGRSKLR